MLVLRRGENRSTRRKTSRSKGENQQQTQPTYGVDAGIRTRATLVGGECSHLCAILAPKREKKTACRVKVTNLSEQSLHQKYSGTTRVYSLSY